MRLRLHRSPLRLLSALSAPDESNHITSSEEMRHDMKALDSVDLWGH